MSTTQEDSNKQLSRPNVFAFGALMGILIMLLLLAPDSRALKDLPFRYEVCTNQRGEAAHCEVRARFATKDLCEDYRQRVWHSQEPDDIRTYCR